MSQKSVNSEEASRCRLLLLTGASWPKRPLPGLPGLAGLIACQDATAWQPIAENLNVACFLKDDYGSAVQLGLDGAVVTNLRDIDQARKQLGDNAVIGAWIRVSRHDAMLAGEAGADYVIVGSPIETITAELLDFVTWWQDVTVLPVAIACAPDAANIGIQAGADFVVVDLDNLGPEAEAGLVRAFAPPSF